MTHPPDSEPTSELTKEERLERALESSLPELPENKPRGLLGEKGVDIRKVDDFAPDLNAGISQEIDTPVVWAAILVGYLLFFVPGLVILWLSKRFDLRTKVATSVIMALVATAFVAYVTLRR